MNPIAEIELFINNRVFDAPHHEFRLSKFRSTANPFTKYFSLLGSGWLEIDFTINKLFFTAILPVTLHVGEERKVKRGTRHEFDLRTEYGIHRLTYLKTFDVVIKRIKIFGEGSNLDALVAAEESFLRDEKKIVEHFKSKYPEFVADVPRYFKAVKRSKGNSEIVDYKAILESIQTAYWGDLNQNLPLSTIDKVKLLVDAGKLLQFMHQEGDFHRDVKLANLLVHKNKENGCSIRVNDFAQSGNWHIPIAKELIIYPPWPPTLVSNSLIDVWGITIALGILIFNEPFRREVESPVYNHKHLLYLLYEMHSGNCDTTFYNEENIETYFANQNFFINEMPNEKKLIFHYFHWLNGLVKECQQQDKWVKENNGLSDPVTKLDNFIEEVGILEGMHTTMEGFFSLVNTINPFIQEIIPFDENEFRKNLEEFNYEVFKSKSMLLKDFMEEKEVIEGPVCNVYRGEASSYLREKKFTMERTIAETSDNRMLRLSKPRDLEYIQSHPGKFYSYLGSGWIEKRVYPSLLQAGEAQSLYFFKIGRQLFQNEIKKIKELVCYIFRVIESRPGEKQKLEFSAKVTFKLTRYRFNSSLVLAEQKYESYQNLLRNNLIKHLFPLSPRYERTKTDKVFTHALVELMETDDPPRNNDSPK